MRVPRDSSGPRDAIIAAAILLLVGTGAARAQTLREEFEIADGPVHAIVRSGDVVYLGGEFTRVGPATGCVAPLDLVTGRALTFPKVSGYVTIIEPDGEDGWFIAGSFNSVGGLPRENLAHIRSDLTVSPWDARMDAGSVVGLARDGTTLYVGGDFTTVGGAARRRLAALSTVTGLATPWNPQPNNAVFAIAVSGSTVFVSGLFTSIGGTPRYELAALSAVSGLATAWDPHPGSPYGYSVMSMAVRDSVLYVGGNFLQMGTLPRSRLAAIHAVTGAVLPWNPGANQRVDEVRVHDGTVLVGGLFLEAGGAPRSGLAALDAVTGALLPWNPAPGPAGNVEALAVSGGVLYVGGSFDSIGGAARASIAAVDLVTGAATDWDPGASGKVASLCMGGTAIFAGGFFDLIGVPRRERLAALDVHTGRLTDWNPGADDAVRTLAMSGSTLFVGGSFERIAGVARDRIAALDAVTGAALDWNPGTNGSVRALAVAGASVYVGGNFTRIGGLERGRLAEVAIASGTVAPWNPGADSTVRALAVGDGVIYAGGSFGAIGSEPRSRIAALDAATGAATAWRADAGGVEHPDVYALIANGARVLAGGDFSTISGETRHGLAALDAASGAATSWNPWVAGTVYALASDGTTVYAGGDLISGVGHLNLAAVDAVTGIADSWRPIVHGPVQSLAVDGSTVYLGGDFGRVNGAIRRGLAALAGVPTATLISQFVAETQDQGIALRWRLGVESGTGAWVERAGARTGPWLRLPLEVLDEGEEHVAIDRDVENGLTYHYRIVFDGVAGRSIVGPIEATAGGMLLASALVRVSPSPASGPVTIEFAVARESRIRLEVMDLQGRRVATLADAVHRPGRHQSVWSGETERGTAPSGVYFVRFEARGLSMTRRLVLGR